MKQSYSCQQEVLEGVRWDRKRSPEPNLHVRGEDGMKRVVYNMKEKHTEKDRNIKKDTKNTHKKKAQKQKNGTCFQSKTNCYIGSNPP